MDTCLDIWGVKYRTAKYFQVLFKPVRDLLWVQILSVITKETACLSGDLKLKPLMLNSVTPSNRDTNHTVRYEGVKPALPWQTSQKKICPVRAGVQKRAEQTSILLVPNKIVVLQNKVRDHVMKKLSWYTKKLQSLQYEYKTYSNSL